MMDSVRSASLRTRLGILALIPIFLLAVLLALLPPDGVERGEWLQFVGRFHLLIVHFPIALLLLVPVLELMARRREAPDLRLAIDVVFALAILGAIAAATLGWCLARSGGYAGSLVKQHMWAGVSFAAVCCVSWMLRTRSNGWRMKMAYECTLVLAVGLVGWTGYRGGQLSEGENDLIEHMPTSLRSLLGISSGEETAVNLDPHTFYGARIQPLFSGHCVSCHGSSRHKGGLRLNSYAALMRGGKDGPVIKAGNPKSSELFHRITLPPGDDNFMPAENKRPLSAAEVKVIELWISAGASATLAADAIKDVPADMGSPAPAAEITFAQIDPVAVAKARSALASEVQQLQKRFPNTLDYESRGSAELVVNMSLQGSKFGDADLIGLKALADRIVEADFSNTAITDRSSSTLAAMKHLRVLRLMHTNITDSTVRALGSLNQLQSLSLFGTPVTAAALSGIEHLPRLQHIYVGETKIVVDAPLSNSMKGKVFF